MRAKKTTKWLVPEGGGAPLLTMPNIPHPLHGPGCQPRTIVGKTEWDKMRRECYAEHDDVCEICGQKLSGHLKDDYPLHHAHEAYDYNYEQRTLTFKRLICICPSCHSFIHSGRAITMYKNHAPLWNRDMLLDLVEKGFKLIHSWNKQHPDQPKLKCFETIEEWLDEPSLQLQLQALIDQYEIEFYYVPRTDAKGEWGNWRLIYDDEEYWSPYQNQAEWQVAMLGENTKAGEELFAGDEFEKLRKNLGLR